MYQLFVDHAFAQSSEVKLQAQNHHADIFSYTRFMIIFIDKHNLCFIFLVTCIYFIINNYSKRILEFKRLQYTRVS